MSSRKVRDELRLAWGVLTPTLPFVETINELPDPATVEEDLWATFVFEGAAADHQTMGARPWVEEQGTATVAIFGRGGVGDQQILAVAEEVTRAWSMWINSAKDVWIHSVDPPRSPDLEAVGDTFRLAVPLNYRYQTRGGS